MFLDTSCICDVLYCAKKQPQVSEGSSFYLSAVTDTEPHAALALLNPAQNCTFQQDDVPCSTSRTTKMSFSFFVICLQLIVLIQANTNTLEMTIIGD